MKSVPAKAVAVGENCPNRRCVQSPAACWMKRGFDILCSLIGLVAFSPLMLCVYMAIRLDGKGAVLFRQERVGYRGRLFVLYKFRTMIVCAEADGKPMLCQKDDARLTRVGKFLRKHHLDELPQLWNVLKGDMSFVGPRPERKYFVDKIRAINPDYELLYQLRPGLFSWATLYNGYTDTMEKMLERLRMDLEYLHGHTLWMDVKIICLTMILIIKGGGNYEHIERGRTTIWKKQ